MTAASETFHADLNISAEMCGYEFGSSKNSGKNRCSRKQRDGDKIITIPQFIELATFLASHSIVKLTQQSCEDFLSTLNSVIDARSLHNAWYRGHVCCDEDAQKSHVFFVDVLKQARDLMGPDFARRASNCLETAGKSTPLSDSTSANGNQLFMPRHDKRPIAGRERPKNHAAQLTFMNTALNPSSLETGNPFNHLHLQQPSEQYASVKPSNGSSTAASGRSGSPQYRAEPINDDEEMWLAIRCFFEDLDDVREFFFAAFQAVASQEVSVSLCGMVTHVGLDLVHRAEIEFENQFPGHSLSQGAKLLYESRCRTQQGQSLMNLIVTSLSEPFRFEDWDFVVSKMIPALTILESLQSIRRPWASNYEAFTNSPPGVPYLKDCKSAKDIFENQSHFVASLWADLTLVARFMPKLVGLDHLITFAGKCVEGERVSISAAFALQTLLDVRQVSGECEAEGFAEFSSCVLEASNMVEDTVAFAGMVRPKECPDVRAKSFQRTLQLTQYATSNPIEARRTELGLSWPEGIEGSSYLLEIHPALSGTMQAELAYVVATEAIEWCENTASIMKAMHLYNACRAEGLLQQDWASMEELINIFSAKHLFVGNRPSKDDDYYKRFCLASGMSPRVLARDSCGCTSKKRHVLSNKRKARGFKLREAAPLWSRLHDKFEGDERAVTEAMYQVVQNTPVSRESCEWESVQGWMLSCVCETLGQERRAVDFDYLKLDRECWSLLAAVIQSLKFVWSQVTFDGFDPGSINYHEVSNVVLPILSEVSIEKNKKRCVCCNAKFRTFGNEMLKAAAECMDSAIVDFNGNEPDFLQNLMWGQHYQDVLNIALENGISAAEFDKALKEQATKLQIQALSSHEETSKVAKKQQKEGLAPKKNRRRAKKAKKCEPERTASALVETPEREPGRSKKE
ncbi:MAG: hypothetical protein Q9162_007103 [Coniocarpon cinnabarinum]